jgi:tricorn protease
VSQLLLEKLARQRVGYDVSRWREISPYPADSPAGPLVCLTNENAGSDGDIFSHCFKLYKLGPLIGRRTWGGVIGIWPRHAMADGSVTTQPEFSFWFKDVGFGVENYGTDPDIDIDILPGDYAKGRDPQLEKGVDLALERLRKHAPLAPDVSKRPNLAPPARLR